VDCGGPGCPPCEDSKACKANADCVTAYCEPSGVCAQPCGDYLLPCCGNACTVGTVCVDGSCQIVCGAQATACCSGEATLWARGNGRGRICCGECGERELSPQALH